MCTASNQQPVLKLRPSDSKANDHAITLQLAPVVLFLFLLWDQAISLRGFEAESKGQEDNEIQRPSPGWDLPSITRP